VLEKTVTTWFRERGDVKAEGRFRKKDDGES
jgi:hypothetical protein